MRTAKDFLREECSSLKEVLEETLRFKYSLDSSGDFYEECQARLTYISDELAKTPDTDYPNLQNLSVLLVQLSALISRIERSSISEYSWPFVTELKRIAVAMCSEPTLTNPNTPPEIHVLSAGGLDTYAIQPELTRPSGSRKRIHTIVFPRTLKHFVLLHAILGHEIGHAMWRCSQHQATLRSILAQHLLPGGPFADAGATAAWLYSNAAPDPIKAHLAKLAPRGVNQHNFFGTVASWQAWIEEILCDLIGLLTFGPSFIAAECNLWYALDPTGTSLGPRHPPVGSRANYVLAAAALLGYDRTDYDSPRLRPPVEAFWATLRAKRKTEAWFDVFGTQQLESTVRAISTLLQGLPPALYPIPTERDLALVVSNLAEVVPPVGFWVEGTAINAARIDFRHVLYGGWVAVETPPKDVSFAQINRLCEHGIMQQYAINMQSVP